jgi:hypothetical protein
MKTKPQHETKQPVRAPLSIRLSTALAIISFATTRFAVAQDCTAVCSTKYGAKNATLGSGCANLCADHPQLFDVDYPYLLGPLPMKPYAELTGAPAAEINAAFPSNSSNHVYVRVNADRDKIQFYLNMTDNPEPYFPYFAMHLHHGNLIKEEMGGQIMVHIAGAGDLVGCAGISRSLKLNVRRLNVCSPQCTKGNHKLGNCINPKRYIFSLRRCPICNQVAAGAYFCKGGCQGDRRISGKTIKGLLGRSKVERVAPSRFCDINNPNRPSNPKQRQWIQGLYSHEFSGNETDGKLYSKWSIGIPENYDYWCKESLPFLVDNVFQKGAASYVALHTNFNATGLPALLYGDVFAPVSTSEGGVQACTIFGNPSLPCSLGVTGILKPLGAVGAE